MDPLTASLRSSNEVPLVIPSRQCTCSDGTEDRGSLAMDQSSGIARFASKELLAMGASI